MKGTIQALFVSRLPRPFLDGNPGVGRLFSDSAAEEDRYFREEGLSRMHVLAFKRELSERYPDLPGSLFSLFEQAPRESLAAVE